MTAGINWPDDDWLYVIVAALILSLVLNGCAAAPRAPAMAATQDVARGGDNYARCPYGLDTEESVRELLRGAESECGDVRVQLAAAEAATRTTERERDYWRSIVDAQRVAAIWEKIGWGSAGVAIGAVISALLVVYGSKQ